MKANSKFFIGIDVSKPFFDASLMAVTDHQKRGIETARFDNTLEGLKAFGKWLKSFKVAMDPNTLVVIENTGIYHRLIWSFCNKKACLCILVMLLISNGALVLPEAKMTR
ncbi:IS110 family transposase [Pedobacter panaciterrae]